MIYAALFFEFFKVGLFSVGGGLATVPFLTDMSVRTGWFTSTELADMIAIAESTPGPLGVNMATYVGFHTGGIPGGIIATLGLICPAIILITVIAGFLTRFRENRTVDAVFYGIRPASTALITCALAEVCSIALFMRKIPLPEMGVIKTQLFNWPCIILAAVLFIALRFKPLKKLHPIVFIAFSAAAGIVFQL